ncbi:MAG: alcohol dehydrogenase catalytic domain-containing protein [Rickettsiales bacterium]|nr:alcohol dehydrogenase catalytic domain-containing protein [Rickettsiales bacterium]
MSSAQHIVVESPGKDYSLRLAAMPLAEPNAQEVRVKVAYAGVNRADLYQAEGRYHPPKGASEILGLEVSGVVEAVGEEVTMHRPGDVVCALLSGGGYAEYVNVPEWRALPVPDGLTLDAAAAVPEALYTAYLNLMDIGRLRPGETVLIHGGASGVGHLAIQLAVALGARVYATAGSAEKCRFCEGLGALRGIHYATQDFESVLCRRWAGRGLM